MSERHHPPAPGASRRPPVNESGDTGPARFGPSDAALDFARGVD